MADDNSKQYAIATFRKEGPIKTWSDLRGIHAHNSRLLPVPNAIEDGAPPIHLIGSGNLVADVKAVLKQHNIAGPREDGVICYTAVLTASPAFFTTRDGETDEQADQRIMDWGQAQMPFLFGKYGEHRIAALTLHLDEETPHFHPTIVPLKLSADGRSKAGKAGVETWSLCGRSISGPGEFDKLQDEYGAAMERFGLSRGERNSDRKYEPYSKTMARAAERERIAIEAEIAGRAAGAQAEQQRQIFLAKTLEAERDVARAAQLRADGEAFEAETKRIRDDLEVEVRLKNTALAEGAAILVADSARYQANEQRQAAAWLEFHEEEAELRKAVAAVEAERVELVREREEARAAIETGNAIVASLSNVMAAAHAYMVKAKALKGLLVPAAIAEAFRAGRVLKAEGEAVQPPVNDCRPATLATFADINRQAAGLGI